MKLFAIKTVCENKICRTIFLAPEGHEDCEVVPYFEIGARFASDEVLVCKLHGPFVAEKIEKETPPDFRPTCWSGFGTDLHEVKLGAKP